MSSEFDEVTFGFPSLPQAAYAPQWQAIETASQPPMEAEFLQNSELAIQALLQGDIDVLSIGVGGPMRAIAEGADLAIFGVVAGNDWVLVSRADVSEVEDLTGRTLAIHSQTSTATPMVQRALDEAGATPTIIEIPGGPNRAQALLQGEIDVAPMFLSDAISLVLSQSDEFKILVDFGEIAQPSNTLVATRSWLNDNADAAAEMLAHFTETARGIGDDPSGTVEFLEGKFPDDDPALLADLVNEYTDLGLWVEDGGQEIISNFDEVIETSTELGALPEDASLDPSTYVDLSILEQVGATG